MSGIKPGRVMSNEEIILGLKDALTAAKTRMRLSRESMEAIRAAIERMGYMERRIEDLEERVDILMAEIPDTGGTVSGLVTDD